MQLRMHKHNARNCHRSVLSVMCTCVCARVCMCVRYSNDDMLMVLLYHVG